MQPISRKVLPSHLWSCSYQVHAAHTLSIISMYILQDSDRSDFGEAFPEHISPQWFLSSVNSSVTLWITLLNSIYMPLYFFPCSQSYLMDRIVSSSRAESRPALHIFPQVFSTSVCHENILLKDSLNQVSCYYSLWNLDKPWVGRDRLQKGKRFVQQNKSVQQNCQNSLSQNWAKHWTKSMSISYPDCYRPRW